MDDLLFNKGELRHVLERQEQALVGEIEKYDQAALLNTPLDDLLRYFDEKYRLEAPRLLEDQISTEQQETQVDARHEPDLLVWDSSRPLMVPGTKVTFFIPFSGEPELFQCRPSTFTFNPPRGTVRGQELLITRLGTRLSPETLKADFQRELTLIKQYLDCIERDVRPFNEGLHGKAQARIDARRQKLVEARGVVAGLGFPVRRREHAPQTYAPPEVRRRLPPTPPRASPAAPLEPTLPDAEYEHILSILRNMALVLERSPSAFVGMEEEHLRQHFLVQLNGQYEGQATGETFNSSGKTDILLRIKGRNVFVAECKFWEGQSEFKKAIDQLLGYLTWRDTKAALLLFNRTKNFGAVLEKAKATLQAHPNFRRELPYASEAAYRCALSHPNDRDRELTVTLLAFEIPVAASETGLSPADARSSAAAAPVPPRAVKGAKAPRASKKK